MLFISCVCHAFASFVASLWSSAGKGLTSWLSCVMFSSHVVSWVRCGTWMYRFLIFAVFLTFIIGAPEIIGIWREWLFIFREMGSTGNYFQGFWKQAHSLGI